MTTPDPTPSPTPLPYYDEDGITIYHGDCREVLAAGPSIHADVLITDPPYGVGLTVKRHRWGEQKAASASYDDGDEVADLLREAIPVALDRSGDRGMVFSGARNLWAYPPASAVGAVFLTNGSGMSSWGFQCSHQILYYGKDPYLADGRGSMPNGLFDKGFHRETVDHPCPKPISWMTWAIERASREGETVLDPFMGSGTTLVAAKRHGRKAIGIEIEERYCEIAVKRLAQGVLL